MKTVKTKVAHISQSDYYFGGDNYSEKLYNKEQRFLQKLRDKRWDDILNQCGKFKWTKQNIQKLVRASDAGHKKYLELVKKIQKLEKQIELVAGGSSDYKIVGQLYCIVPFPNGDECRCEIVTEYSFKESPLKLDDWMLRRNVKMPIGPLMNQKLSYPFYCLIDEHRMSFQEVAVLEEKDFGVSIRIELD